MILLGCSTALAVASDVDFAKTELNRVARSRLSGNQAQTVNLLDRYQRQKQAQKAVPSAVVPGAGQAANTANSNAAGAGSTGNSDSPTAGEIPASYSLSKDDCEQLLASVVAKKLDKGVILKAQQQLFALGLYQYKLEGVLGLRTAQGLMQFCEAAKFALSEDLLEMLQSHAVIYQAYPDWIQILASREFGTWAGAQRDHDQIGKTRQLGNSTAVIALLDRYKNRKIEAPVVWSGDSLISYVLTKDDLKLLKSSNEVFKLIGKLQAKPYASEKEFQAALETAFKGVAEPERYMHLIRKHSEPQAGLMLTDESFKKLKVKNVPGHVLKSIQGLKGLSYPDTEINAAVEDIIGTLADRLKTFKAEEIVKLAEVTPSGARFTVDSLKRFMEAQDKDDPMAAAILDRLQKMKEIEYQNSKTMTSAMKNVLKQVMDDLNKSVPAIIAETEANTTYSLSEEAMQEINDQLQDFTVAEIYLDLLADVQDMDYPDPDLFWHAVKARIAMLGPNATLKRSIFGVIEKNLANKVDEILLGKLRDEKVPPSVLAQLGTLKDRTFANKAALEDAVQYMFMQLSEQFEASRPLVVAQARKIHVFDKTKDIQWTGGFCNCVHSTLSGDVYGFYPYWLAGEKHQINFGLVTRIGYYGLGFDDHGDIPDATRWSGLDTGFIREAQAYGTKLDLVIYRNAWHTWKQISPQEKAAAFQKLSANIVDLINIPLTHAFAKVQPYVSLGMSQSPVMGDGVTLYFEGYPQDAASVDAFHVFIHTLSEQLKAHGRRRAVNIMFHSADVGSGIYDLPKLAAMLNTISDPKLKIRFLIMLQEPTTSDKKQLRTRIEDGLPALNRMKVLRAVVMVNTLDGRNERQLTADVIFAENNFGGIGFWHQPVSVDGNSANSTINAILHKWYMTTVTGATLQNAGFCRYICPNKWAFRIAWGVLLFILLACVVLYYQLCDYRTVLDKHFIPIIAGLVVPMFVLGILLMSCDPGWAEISNGNDILVIVIIAVIGYAIWNYWDKKKKANLP